MGFKYPITTLCIRNDASWIINHAYYYVTLNKLFIFRVISVNTLTYKYVLSMSAVTEFMVLYKIISNYEYINSYATGSTLLCG